MNSDVEVDELVAGSVECPELGTLVVVVLLDASHEGQSKQALSLHVTESDPDPALKPASVNDRVMNWHMPRRESYAELAQPLICAHTAAHCVGLPWYG